LFLFLLFIVVFTFLCVSLTIHGRLDGHLPTSEVLTQPRIFVVPTPSNNLRKGKGKEQPVEFPSWTRGTDPSWGTSKIQTDVNNPEAGVEVNVPSHWDGNLDFNEVVEGFSHIRCSDGVLRPMIFVSIASYRDYMCPLTVANILEMAVYPERIRFAVIQQNVPGLGDTRCDVPPEVPCDSDPSQTLCKHAHQIELYELDATTATGPVTARAIGSRFYHGERYQMQIDAHLEFIIGWDEDIIAQHKATKNDYAVLTTYLSEVVGSLNPDRTSRKTTIPIMCESTFTTNQQGSFLQHGSQPETNPPIKGVSIISPYYAAGFSFSSGKFVQQVPYDHNLPMIFQGEEISMGIRGWTHGYDYYTPQHSICFHYYSASKGTPRKHVPMFWDNANKHSGTAKKSMKRLTKIIKMNPDAEYVVPDEPSDLSQYGRYGLGKVREPETFYHIFGIDVARKVNAKRLCRYVCSGKLHNHVIKHLLPNGGPIDYSGDLKDFVVPNLEWHS